MVNYKKINVIILIGDIMYNIDYKNIKKGYLLWLPFLGIGIILFTVFFILEFSGFIKKSNLDSKILAYNIEVDCYINDEGDKMCSPKYYYKVDNNLYICKVNYYSNKEIKQSQNMVYYDSKNPKNCVTDFTSSPNIISFIILLLPTIFIVIGFIGTIKRHKKIRKIKYLETNGILIKNIPYNMEKTKVSYNNVPLYAISIDYTLPDGKIIKLVGEPRYDGKIEDSDGKVDLLIDPSDEKNYYIDFNITRKY